MSDIGELIVKFGMDSSSFKSGLDEIGNSLKKTEGSIKTGFSKLGGAVVAGAGVAVVGLTGFIADCTIEASKASDIQAQLASVLTSTGGASGMTADSVNSLASSLASCTKFEDDAIVSAENMLLTFTNIGKDVFPTATETVLDMSQALGQDLKSSSIQLGKALNDPIAGITALSRVGVSFTDDQKKQIESFMAVNDVASAQKIILAELAKEFGGSAKAAGETLSGKLEILKNKFGDIKEAIGEVVIPILSDLATTLSNKLSDPAFISFISQFTMAVGNFALAVVSYLPVIAQTFENLILFFQNNQGVVVAILAVLGIAVATFAYTSAIALWAMVAPILPFIAALALIGVAVYALYQAWTTNFGGIQEKTASVVEFIKSAWQNLTTFLTTVWNMFTSVFTPLFQAFTAAINGDWHLFGEKLRQAWDAALNNLTTIATAWWDTTKSNFKTAIDSVVGFFKNTDWNGVGTAIIRGIGDGISSMIGWLVDMAKSAAIAAYEAAKGFLGINSPSKMTFDLGKNFMVGFGNGIEKFQDFPVSMSLNASALSANALSSSGGNRSTGFNVGDINITINGNADSKVVKSAVEESLLDYARSRGGA